MKTLRNYLWAAPLTLLGLWTVSASAAVVFNDDYAGNATYIGSYDPAAGDSGTFSHTAIVPGTFEDTWVFHLSADGVGTVNANFLPGGGISGFTVALWDVSDCASATLGGTCSVSLLGGSAIRTGTPGTDSSGFGWTSLDTGYYGIVVSGTNQTVGTLYSGQLLTADVPEPTVLALLGLGLAGLGFSLRRKQ